MEAIQMKDNTAKSIVIALTVVVLGLVVFMYTNKSIEVELGFDLKIFPKFHALLNSLVSVALVVGLYFIKQKNMKAHKVSMLTAFVLSTIFLLSYVFYHTISETTVYGGEGFIRYIYYFILATHIILAALILPFILMTMLRALSGKFQQHAKVARYTWPVWFYVSVTGVIVYFMISPYY